MVKRGSPSLLKSSSGEARARRAPSSPSNLSPYGKEKSDDEGRLFGGQEFLNTLNFVGAFMMHTFPKH